MNILITAIGSFSADCVVLALKKAGHKVVGCDIYPSEWHPVSKDCNKTYQVPFATDNDNYINSIKEICLKENIEMLFPLTDLEIDVLNENREIFSEIQTKLCIQSQECLSIARNKYNLTRLFEKDTYINVPRTILASVEEADLSFPVIAKPINGRSSEGLYRLYSKNDISTIKNKENYIIQEILQGNVYTVDYVRDSNGNDFSVPREELLRTKNGAGTTVRIVPDHNLQNQVSYIGNKLNVIGCINMEFILNKGRYYLIDINPRFSAGVAFSNFIGFDMVISHLNCFLNRDILEQINFSEQIICKRYYEELI